MSRLLYWADWGDNPSINVVDVVSGQQEVIISGGLLLPNALVIDFKGQGPVSLTTKFTKVNHRLKLYV